MYGLAVEPVATLPRCSGKSNVDLEFSSPTEEGTVDTEPLFIPGNDSPPLGDEVISPPAMPIGRPPAPSFDMGETAVARDYRSTSLRNRSRTKEKRNFIKKAFSP
jgi:hypothetical protein